MSLLRDKPESQIKNAEEQQVHIKRRSIIDAVFVIKQIKEKATEFNITAYICFIDVGVWQGSPGRHSKHICKK